MTLMALVFPSRRGTVVLLLAVLCAVAAFIAATPRLALASSNRGFSRGCLHGLSTRATVRERRVICAAPSKRTHALDNRR